MKKDTETVTEPINPPSVPPWGAPEAGVSLVRYRPGKDETKRAGDLPAVVLSVDGAGVAALTVLGAAGGRRVENIAYGTKPNEKGEAYWFWPSAKPAQ